VSHIQKRGPGRWRARFRAPSGQELSRTFERRVDAKRFLADAEADKGKGVWINPALGRITLTQWVGTWEATAVDLRPTTRALNAGVVRNYLVPRFGGWPLARIRTSDVTAMVAEELGAGVLSNSAIRRHVFVLSSILASAVADGRLARNPCAGVKLPPEDAREMRFLEPADVLRLADALHPHYRPLILTAAYVGLRWGELAGLRVDRVDLLRRQIRVDQQLVEVGGHLSFGPPKTKESTRTVTMPRALVDVLGPHFATPPVRASGLAFPGPKGVPMRRAGFRRPWRRACTAAGFDGGPLDGLVFHELRHTAAALAVATGAHPLAIKERLGHSSINVTLDRYGGLFPSLDEAVADGLDNLIQNSLAASSRPEPGEIAYLRRSEG
jgi:integrase